MAKPEHEHHKADPHAEEANESTGQDKSLARQGCAKQDGQRKIGRTGDKPLDHRDLEGISRRQLAREVVVDAP